MAPSKGKQLRVLAAKAWLNATQAIASIKFARRHFLMQAAYLTKAIEVSFEWVSRRGHCGDMQDPNPDHASRQQLSICKARKFLLANNSNGGVYLLRLGTSAPVNCSFT